jgi:hypothetical protein
MVFTIILSALKETELQVVSRSHLHVVKITVRITIDEMFEDSGNEGTESTTTSWRGYLTERSPQNTALSAVWSTL